jgi:Zn-finger nucleic acid-binding protein
MEIETIFSSLRIYIKLLIIKGGAPLLKKILKSLMKHSHQQKYSGSSDWKKYKHHKHSHLGHDYYKKKKKSGSFFSSFFSS